MHNQAPIQRRKSTRIYVGNVPIGDGAPIAVQSMTNTRTTDVEATVNQIKALERVGADIVRVSVPTMDAAEAFKLIKQQVNVPLVPESQRYQHLPAKVEQPHSVADQQLVLAQLRQVFACWLRWYPQVMSAWSP